MLKSAYMMNSDADAQPRQNAEPERRRPGMPRSFQSLQSPVVGLLSIWFIAAANTLVQLASGDEMRGRMMGLSTMALPGAQVVTGPFAGWVTQDVGPREGFALPAMALTAIAGAGWRALTASTADAGVPRL